MKPSLLFATHNAHKVQEVIDIAGTRAQILSLAESGLGDLVLLETQDTFPGNALQKAQAVFELTSRNCFSDDSGLEVEALDGRPGVFTSRYAGINATAGENIEKLLAEMDGVQNRNARFRTVIALILDGSVHFFDGTAEGTIALSPAGEKGFGYDPVFVPVGFDKTFAELPAEVKNAQSHRAKAVEAMMAFLYE